MIKALLMVSLVFTLTACSNGKPRVRSFDSDICNRAVDGYTQTRIIYGDSHISMKPRSEVIQNSEFRYLLVPDKGFENTTVKIIKKNNESEIVETSGSIGISKSGVLTADKCIPIAVPIGTVYQFEVHVDGVGMLDPRAEVVPK